VWAWAQKPSSEAMLMRKAFLKKTDQKKGKGEKGWKDRGSIGWAQYTTIFGHETYPAKSKVLVLPERRVYIANNCY